MLGIKIDSWERLVSEFAQELDMSSMEAWPYVDLTGQATGTHVNSMYGDPMSRTGRLKKLPKSDCAITTSNSGTGRSSARIRRTSPCSSARRMRKRMHDG